MVKLCARRTWWGARRRMLMRLTVALQLVVLCSLWGVASSAGAQGCVKYSDFLHTTGSVDTPDAAIGIAVAGSYAYVADRLSGLQVIDVSAPESSQIVGSVDTPGRAWGIAVSGRYAYVADRSTGLQIIDVSDPRSPQVIGSVETPDAYSVAVVANHVYIADTLTGLLVIDVSDPSSPRVVGSQPLSIAAGVAVASGYAYVADFGSGLRAIDVSDPAAPRIVGSVDTPDPEEGPLDVAVVGTHVYVTHGRQGLEVIDVSDPASPQKLAHLYMPGISRSVAVAGTYAYVSNTLLPGIQVIDISDPASPQVVGSLSTPGTALGVAASGSLTYVAAALSGLRIIDSRNPRSPRVGSVDTGDQRGTSGRGVAVSGSYAYVADGVSGLQVVDISDPLLPRIVGSLQTPHLAYDVAAAGNYVCVGEGASLEVVDASDPTSPRVVGSIETLSNPPQGTGSAHELAVDGSIVYFASSPGLIHAVDLNDPTSPRIVGWSDVVTHATDLTVANGYAYVAGGDSYSPSSFSVFDIRELPTLRRVGSTQTFGSAQGVAVAGDCAYVTDGQCLRVLDVSVPSSPTVVGSVEFPNFVLGVAVADNFAYVADGLWIHVIDVSDPRSPRVHSSVLMQGSTSIALTDHHVCVAASTFGLEVTGRQCGGPTPVLVQDLMVQRHAKAVRLTWRLAAGAAGDLTGVHVQRAEDARGPYSTRTAAALAPCESMSFEDHEVAPRSSYWYRLLLLMVGGVETVVGPVQSSPGSSAVPELVISLPTGADPIRIRYAIQRSGTAVRLGVYDATGRRLLALDRGHQEPGGYLVNWDARDTLGRRLSSGVYIARLQADRASIAKKFVLLR